MRGESRTQELDRTEKEKIEENMRLISQELNLIIYKIIDLRDPTMSPENGERQPADKENSHHGHQQPARPVDGGACGHSY